MSTHISSIDSNAKETQLGGMAHMAVFVALTEVPVGEDYFTLHLRKNGAISTFHLPVRMIKAVIVTNSKQLYLHLEEGYFGPFTNTVALQNRLDRTSIKVFLP